MLDPAPPALLHPVFTETVGRVLDLRALVVAARMSGEGLQALDDAQPAGIGQHGQGASHMSMRHRVIVWLLWR